MIIEGSLSVKAVLENGKHQLHRLIIQSNKHSKDINYILHLAHRESVAIERVDEGVIDSLTTGKTHGGILLECEARTNENLTSISGDLVLLVEGVEDPFNLGMIMRTAYIMGASTIITPYRDLKHSEPVLIKASAGASEKLVWHQSDDLVLALKHLHDEGFIINSAMRTDDSIEISKADLTGKTVLAIGGEMRGLSRAVIEASDVYVTIPYPFNARIALSAVSAASMCLYEASSQRLEKNHETST